MRQIGSGPMPGVTINGLVRWTVGRGIAGVEMWAGTPGTVGGAIYGNAHFKGRLIGELVRLSRIVAKTGVVDRIAADRMEFGYDRSRLQRTRRGAVSGRSSRWRRASPRRCARVARESLAYRKRTQPLDIAERRLHVSESRPGP